MKNKIKTKRGVKKRFKITATGKIVHKKAGSIHFGRKKRGSRKRTLRIKNVVDSSDVKRIRRSLGKTK